MKKISLLVWMVCLWFSVPVQAESVTLVWTPSSSGDVVSYRVYQSLINGIFAIGPECNAVVVVDGTDECMTRAIVPDLTAGYRYHFVVTAIDETGTESMPSNMISITIDPENANPTSAGIGDMQATIQ